MRSAARDASIRMDLFRRSCAAVKVMALVPLSAAGGQRFPGIRQRRFVPRCWVSGFVLFCAVSTVPLAALAGSSCTVV